MKKLLLATLLSTPLFSAPAFMGDLKFIQNDGTTFYGKLNGDEWFNWVEDRDGHIIKYSKKSKNFEYAKIKQVNNEIDLVPSGTKVGSKLSTLSEAESKISHQTLNKIWRQKREKALDLMYNK